MAQALQIASKKIPVEKDYLEYLQGIRDYTLTKPLPSAVELEEAVLGALLTDNAAYGLVKSILDEKCFYKETHQSIFAAATALAEKNAPIDILTITQQLQKMGKLGLGAKKNVEQVQASYLVELTSKVASAANIEYHSRIILQKQKSREGIEIAAKLLKKLLEDTEDVFDLRNDAAKLMRTLPDESFFAHNDINSDIEKGKQMPEMKAMVGTLWNKSEVCFLFASPGTGKSILALQIAECLANGEDVIPNYLQNECDPQKVLFLDFELTNRNLYERYTNKETGKSYRFNQQNLRRITINANFLDIDKGIEKLTYSELDKQIADFEPEILIVDNISYLTGESTSDMNIAMRLMKKLMGYKHANNMSILIVAHTIKGVNKFMQFEASHMAGASQLEQFIDTKFGLKSSALDSKMIYLKQFKGRNKPMIYNEELVLLMSVSQRGEERNFLSFEYMATERELQHIVVPEDDEEAMSILLKKAIEIKIESAAKGIKMGYRKIAKEIGWKRTFQNLHRRMQEYAESSVSPFEYDPETGVFKYEDAAF